MQLWYFRSHASQTGKVLTLSAAGAAGATLSLANNDNALTQLFQFKENGLIVSAYNASMALTSTGNGVIQLQQVQAGNQNQIWQMTGPRDPWGCLWNDGAGEVISVAPGTEAISLRQELDPPHGQLWVVETPFDCDYFLVTINNTTPNNLYITINSDVEGICPIPTTAQVPLLANTNMTFWVKYSGGLVIPVQIWDPNVSTTYSVASFVGHQKHCGLVGAKMPWFDQTNYVNGYSLSTSVEEGSKPNSLPGLGFVTVSWNGSNAA